MNLKQAAVSMGFFVLAAGGLAATTKGQIPENEILRATIPFRFTVQDRTFPAGDYTIRQLDLGGDSEFLLELASSGGNVNPELFETMSVTAQSFPKRSDLVFDKVGDDYFLSRIFVAGSEVGNEVPISRMEKRLINQDRVSELVHLRADRGNGVKRQGKTGAGK